MINTKIFMERFLQKQRFSRVIPLLNGDVMDFGGNEGELKPYVKGDYLVVNYDHSVMKDRKFDIIVALAVVEHIDFKEVFKIFNKLAKNHLKGGGRIFLTTPTKPSKPVLELMAKLGIIQKENIEEHKHYWNKKELINLARSSGLKVEKYRRFQLGFNQFAIYRKP